MKARLKQNKTRPVPHFIIKSALRYEFLNFLNAIFQKLSISFHSPQIKLKFFTNKHNMSKNICAKFHLNWLGLRQVFKICPTLMMESQIYKGVDTCYLPLDKFKIAIRIGQWTLARFSVETNSDCGRLDTCYLPLATLSIGKCPL